MNGMPRATLISLSALAKWSACSRLEGSQSSPTARLGEGRQKVVH
jgi:hypothetical protein